MGIFLTDELTESDEWLDMSHRARSCLIELWSYCARAGNDNLPAIEQELIDQLVLYGWAEWRDDDWHLVPNGQIRAARAPWEPLRHRAKIPTATRVRIYERDGWKCCDCGDKDDLTLDHIHPWSLGGSDEEANLRTLCRRCNSSKGAKI